MRLIMPICPICQREYNFLQIHHIIPRCYGLGYNEVFQINLNGQLCDLTSESTVAICENDHIHTIHETANRLLRGLNPLETIPDTYLKNAAPYIRAILEADKRLKGRNATLRNLGRVRLSDYEWYKLQIKAKDMGCKHITEYIEKLIKLIVK